MGLSSIWNALILFVVLPIMQLSHSIKIERFKIGYTVLDNYFSTKSINATNFELRFIKELDVDNNTIFYSGYYNETNERIILFGRYKIAPRKLMRVELDTNFSVVQSELTKIKGEDPRQFTFKNSIFVVDNYWDDIHLININEMKYTKVYKKGKNFVWFTNDTELFFLHSIKPISIYKVDLKTGNVSHVKYTSDVVEDKNPQYRGGTPFYSFFPDKQFAFGHRTYMKSGVLTHDPFLIIHKDGKFDVFDIPKPVGALSICDPCSIIRIKNKLFLTTAETDIEWSKYPKIRFHNKIYELVFK